VRPDVDGGEHGVETPGEPEGVECAPLGPHPRHTAAPSHVYRVPVSQGQHQVGYLADGDLLFLACTETFFLSAAEIIFYEKIALALIYITFRTSPSSYLKVFPPLFSG
jgi:hypothetical protein